MAVAKGADIPAARLLDAVEATAHALTAFEAWAGIKASAIEPGTLHAVDEMQIRLAAWQNDRFGHVPTSDVHIALGVIEELGEAFDEDAGPEESIDALGDVMVYAAQLCTANRLAVRPVIGLAVHYVKTNACHAHAIALAGQLAHVCLKHAQGIRGLGPFEAYRPRLVDALALMIAKAIEDCAIGHELTVDPDGVFVVVGGEVLARKPGDTMIPKAPAGMVNVQVMKEAIDAATEPFRRLAEGVDKLAEAEKVEPGDFQAPTFLRLTSSEKTEACPVFDSASGVWCESDAQLRERINKHAADLSA
ncbi:MAG TPA: hypothetical protein VMZ53_03735 [Kofleriaceae bacterium]|nr:hypothetical protein [Kofleriaceae bacterium]